MIKLKLENNIAESFSSAGIKSSETVMIHADAGVAANYNNPENSEKINQLIKDILDYFNNDGTIVVPTFTYSSTKNEIYDKYKTPSSVGLFTEHFRRYPGVLRSNNPIFSVASIGKNADEFSNSRIDDCFGKKTSFDLLQKYNAQIICLGCSIDSMTFIHYVEQELNVPYRFMKNFDGKIKINENIENIKISYYVRDLKINSECDLGLLQEEAQKEDLIYCGSIGRFPLTAISANNFIKIAKKLFQKNKFSLIKQRFI